MNTYIIHFFFIITIFMVIIMHFKKISNYFTILDENDNQEEKLIKLLYSTFLEKKKEQTRDINLSIYEDNIDNKVSLDWHILKKNLKIDEDIINILVNDQDDEFYIILIFRNNDNSKEDMPIFIKFDKWDNIENQRYFYKYILDKNSPIIKDNKNSNNSLDIYIISKHITDNIFKLSNKETVNLQEDKNENEKELSQDKIDNKMIVSCNPDGTNELGITQSFRKYPLEHNRIEITDVMTDELKNLTNKIDIDITLDNLLIKKK